MSITTPSTGQKISDFSVGTVDADSYLIQARNGSTEKIAATQIGQYSNLNLLFNGASGLDTTNKTIIGAINEVNAKDANDIAYDNTESGMTATDVQSAIDEVVDDGFYHAGDTMSLLRAGMVAYSGTSSLYFTIPLDKPVGDDVTSVSVTGEWRCILTDSSTFAQSVLMNGVSLDSLGTVTCSMEAYGVRVSIALSSPLAHWSVGFIAGYRSSLLTFS